MPPAMCLTTASKSSNSSDVYYLLGNALPAFGVDCRADVYNDQFLETVGMPPGEGQAIAASHGMPHQGEGIQAQCVAEADQVGQIGVSRVITVTGPIAVAPAPLIQRQNVIILAERQRNVIPRVGVTPQAVDEEDVRRALVAPIQIVELHLIV